MKDARGREVDYLRISVTDRCNLRCVYCAPRTGVRHLCDTEMLSFDEIVRVVSVMTHLGVRRIKLTGGEPLMRESLPELIHRLKKIHGIEQVTLTTNGTLLGRAAAGIVDAGIDAVTVSLDTLNREHFFAVTRKDMLDSVLEGIDRMRDYPQVLLKINCVPVGSAEDILSVAAIAKDSPISVRFIERMPLGKDRLSVELSSHDVIQQSDRMINRSTKNYEIDHVSSCNDLDVWQPAAENVLQKEIVRLLEERWGRLSPYEGKPLGNGPAKYFTLPGFVGKIGLISPVSHIFCDRCNRVRLTADGFLKACLQYEGGQDLRSVLRSGADDGEIEAVCRNVIRQKPKEHHFSDGTVTDADEYRYMSQIGG